MVRGHDDEQQNKVLVRRDERGVEQREQRLAVDASAENSPSVIFVMCYQIAISIPSPKVICQAQPPDGGENTHQ